MQKRQQDPLYMDRVQQWWEIEFKEKTNEVAKHHVKHASLVKPVHITKQIDHAYGEYQDEVVAIEESYDGRQVLVWSNASVTYPVDKYAHLHAWNEGLLWMCQLHVKVLRVQYKFCKKDNCVGVGSKICEPPEDFAMWSDWQQYNIVFEGLICMR